MMLNRSSGVRPLNARDNAARACSIDVPNMEPDVSTMKIISRGCGDCSSGGDDDGMTISR